MLFSVLLAALTLFLDYYCKVGEKVPSFFNQHGLNEYVSEYDYARYSIDYDVYLQLNARCVYIICSSVFSSRVKNFASSKSTQRILGIFIGSFCIHFLSFFLNSSQVDGYFAIPFVTTALSVLVRVRLSTSLITL